jgi:hypothetical protein
MRRMILGLMLLTAPAAAQVSANSNIGSNIGLGQYPGPNCTKPAAPVAPSSSDKANPDGFNIKVRQYNAAVLGYNDAIKNFNDCMNFYVANGNADMQRIKQKLDDAIAAANAR